MVRDIHFKWALLPLFGYSIRKAIAGDTSLPWATIGDSWASGVAFGQNSYHGDPACWRINEAYTAQLEIDSSWVTVPQSLQFQACSGARLVDMAQGQQQMQKTGEPNLVLMQNGGNDAHFYLIVLNCIYQFDPEDWNRKYDCDKEVKAAEAYITTPHSILRPWEHTLEGDLQETYKDILNTENARKGAESGEDFHLYHIGYAHFFNLEDDGAWCNNETFGVAQNRPRLTQELRTTINDLTTKLNDKIKDTIESFKPPLPNQHLGFIDISPGFDGHRYCEGAHAPGQGFCTGHTGQYYNLNVWFWNLSPWFIPNCPFVAQDQSPHQPNISLFDYKAASGADVGAGGSALRPFHPKFGGHWAIKDQIIKRLQDDNIPHVKPKDVKDAPPPCGAGSCNGGPIGERSFEG